MKVEEHRYQHIEFAETELLSNEPHITGTNLNVCAVLLVCIILVLYSLYSLYYTR